MRQRADDVLGCERMGEMWPMDGDEMERCRSWVAADYGRDGDLDCLMLRQSRKLHK